MNVTDIQAWLNAHGASLAVDGQAGPATRNAIVTVFTNKDAPAVTDAQIASFAHRLGCSTKQLKAVAQVESSGSAFDKFGRPKILFERHKFHALTNGRYSVTSFSDPKAGGYGEESWAKLVRAAALDPDAAFASASWGKFQVMGFHWNALGYSSSIDMAYSTVTSEAAHYEMLCRYIERNGLGLAIRQLSTNPADNVAFASKYNGSGYRQFRYDEKLAEAMR